LKSFCQEISEQLGLAVEPASTPEAATRYGEIVTTATSAAQPVVYGEWLQPGTHLNAIGANRPQHRELDDRALERVGLITVDSIEQSRKESGDLIEGFSNLGRGWERVIELSTVVTGKNPGRSSPDEITLFKSHGIALWDVAAASYVYRRAREEGKGKDLEID
jgi:ornithine cyclodeaminase